VDYQRLGDKMSKQLIYEPLRTIAIGADYAPFSGGPFANQISIIKVVNLSTETVIVSTDGATDMDVVPTGSFYLYDITTNTSQETGSIYVPQGTQIYAKGAGTGTVYLVALFIRRINALGQT
jgi:hypothetical protein